MTISACRPLLFSLSLSREKRVWIPLLVLGTLACNHHIIAGADPGAGKGRGTNRLSYVDASWGEHILLLVAVFLSSNDHSLVG